MPFVWSHSVPLLGIDPAVFFVESLRNRMKIVRVGHPLYVVRECPVLTLVSD